MGMVSAYEGSVEGKVTPGLSAGDLARLKGFAPGRPEPWDAGFGRELRATGLRNS
jgi:hypothetical protein